MWNKQQQPRRCCNVDLDRTMKHHNPIQLVENTNHKLLKTPLCIGMGLSVPLILVRLSLPLPFVLVPAFVCFHICLDVFEFSYLSDFSNLSYCSVFSNFQCCCFSYLSICCICMILCVFKMCSSVLPIFRTFWMFLLVSSFCSFV